VKTPPTSPLTRSVSAHLEADLTGDGRVELQVAVTPAPGLHVGETLAVTVDGRPLEARELEGEHGSRVHVLSGVSGRLEVAYDAIVTGRAEPAPVTEPDRVVFTRPSRYAESDRLFGFARKQFGAHREAGPDLLGDVVSFVASRLDYVPGSSTGTDGATDTLLGGAGVCRDYAHLTIGLLRALDVPARLAAVYAPGCDPMDFHAVVEAAVGDAWTAVDATHLAPRPSLLRISTGRDAADTAFLTNYGSNLVLGPTVITAVVVGDLPFDDWGTAVALG
jgi:transglutaminase-like putative cysteine protease